MESLHEKYKLDKWDLFFEGEEINKCKPVFVLHVVIGMQTFHDWIKDEIKTSVYTYGYFKCKWK